MKFTLPEDRTGYNWITNPMLAIKVLKKVKGKMLIMSITMMSQMHVYHIHLVETSHVNFQSALTENNYNSTPKLGPSQTAHLLNFFVI
jgi:hypothetical protein